jgi:hypothetical protein
MLEKGILHIPTREELLSLNDVAIGMQSPPSPEYIKHGINGHNYQYPAHTPPEMVFDRLDCFWGGAPLTDYDASRYVYGLERRQCNFLAPVPLGMVAIVPADTPVAPGSRFRQILRTDGQYWYLCLSQLSPAVFSKVVRGGIRANVLRASRQLTRIRPEVRSVRCKREPRGPAVRGRGAVSRPAMSLAVAG